MIKTRFILAVAAVIVLSACGRVSVETEDGERVIAEGTKVFMSSSPSGVVVEVESGTAVV